MSEFVPAAFAEKLAGRPADAAGDVSGQDWLRSLPDRLEERLSAWRLQLDGAPRTGESAIVFPVRQGADRLALKIVWPHGEARHEHLALQAWRGVASVRLVAAHPASWALLLERCEPADDMAALSTLDAAEIVGMLHARLRRPALPQIDKASTWCLDLARRLRETSLPMPRRMVQQGISWAEEFSREPQVDALLIHTDLHDRNVMRARRANTVDGYVAIDPKPLAGEMAMAVAPIVWNRWDEAVNAYNMRNHLRFRVDYACDPMGVDADRARAWTILRVLDNIWHDVDTAKLQRDVTPPDVTRAVAIIKAMQN